jgi:hypothetical protein
MNCVPGGTMTSTIHASSTLYYRESGGFSAGKLVPALIASIVAAAVLGAAYAYCDLYNPCISVLTFLLTIGFGAGCGAVAGWMMRWADVRNRGLRTISSLIVAIVALYSSWVFWLYALIVRYDSQTPKDFSPATFLMHPHVMWNLMQIVNEKGAWSIGGHGGTSSSTPVTGVMLWLCWAAEAVLIVGSSILAANAVGSAFPYCESCNRWARKTKQLFTAGPMNLAELRSQLESKNYAPLIANSPAKATDASWLEVWTHSCDQCQDFNTMTIKQTTQTVDKKGKLQKTTRVKIAHLLLSTIDLRALESIREQQKNPPPQSATPPTAEDQEYEEESDDANDSNQPST